MIPLDRESLKTYFSTSKNNFNVQEKKVQNFLHRAKVLLCPKPQENQKCWKVGSEVFLVQSSPLYPMK